MAPYVREATGWVGTQQRRVGGVRRTTIWLSESNRDALRRASLRTGRTQSALIRKGIERVCRDLSVQESEAAEVGWLTREEEIVVSLTNARMTIEQIAMELRITPAHALQLHQSMRSKLAALSRDHG